MKNFLLALVFVGLGCSTQPINSNIRTQSSVNEYAIATVNYSDPENRIASLNQIKNVYLYPEKSYTAANIGQRLNALTADADYQSLMATYTAQLMSAMQVQDIYEWSDRYPKASGVLHDYIDPQETDENGEPIWQTTNRNLRNSVPLTKAQKAFVKNMTAALDVLPPAQAIVYRGVTLRTADFERYKKNKDVTEKSFVSTSLDPQIGMRFASSGKGDVATLFVIAGYSGRPISFVVPTNMHEMEILFKPNTGFDIVKVVQSKDLKTASIFLKEKQISQ